MANLQSKPIVNLMPGETKDFTAGMKALLHLHSLDTRKLIPAQVAQFDRTKNMATVQPMVMLVDVSDNTRMRKAVANIPVISLGGGGFHISFPLKEGDLGWILASDRDISQFIKSLKAAPPNTFRKHTFSDGWFIPDVFRQYTINSADSAAMVIQTTDGATRISIGQGTVNITAPTSVTVTSPLATFTGSVVIDQNLTVDGQTFANGGFNATGTGGNQPCTLPQDTTIGGIAVYGHGHISSNPGTRTSGGMIT